jgi:hypothetical protein
MPAGGLAGTRAGEPSRCIARAPRRRRKRTCATTSTPRIGHRPLASIGPSEVQAVIKHVSLVQAPSTTEVVYAWVPSIFKAAVTEKKISASHCINIKLLTAHPAPIVTLAPRLSVS